MRARLATIVDANFTTFIAAVILFYMGTGPVKGFAVTLAIGIMTTVFTAFTLTRWMVVALAAQDAAEGAAERPRPASFRTTPSCRS